MAKKTGHRFVIINSVDEGNWLLCKDLDTARVDAGKLAIALHINGGSDAYVTICEMIEYVDVEVVKTVEYKKVD